MNNRFRKKCEININNHNGGKVLINCGHGEFCDDDDDCKRPSFNMTLHEYVMLEYFRRVDRERIRTNVLANYKKFTHKYVINRKKMCEFMYNNNDTSIEIAIGDVPESPADIPPVEE
jgi:hypothetical protein